MSEKEALFGRRDMSTWTAYIAISLAVAMGIYCDHIYKENKRYQSYINEVSKNMPMLKIMRQMYSESVLQKMQQNPEWGPFMAVASVHDDFKKQLSGKNATRGEYFNSEGNNDKPLSPETLEKIVSNELAVLSSCMSRRDFKQLLLVYPYVEGNKPLWKRSSAEEVQDRISKYQSVIFDTIREGVKSRTR